MTCPFRRPMSSACFSRASTRALRLRGPLGPWGSRLQSHPLIAPPPRGWLTGADLSKYACIVMLLKKDRLIRHSQEGCGFFEFQVKSVVPHAKKLFTSSLHHPPVPSPSRAYAPAAIQSIIPQLRRAMVMHNPGPPFVVQNSKTPPPSRTSLWKIYFF